MKHMIFACAASCLMVSRAAQTFNPADDFSIAENPHGVWTYGSMASIGDDLHLLANTLPFTGVSVGLATGLEMWWTNGPGGDPLIAHNPLPTTFSAFNSTVEPGGISLHPGPNGELAVIRFTAPGDGVYEIDSSFFGQNAAPTSTDVHVLINGDDVFDGIVQGFGQPSRKNFKLTRQLTKGSTIDFAVGFGANGTYNSDLTGLDLQIRQVAPVFDAKSDFSASGNPIGAWSYGYSTDLGFDFVLFDQPRKRNAMDYWTTSNGPDPGVGHNPTKALQPLNEVVFQPHQLAVHAGPQGEYAIVRWTAPTAGQYLMNASFIGEGGRSSVDVHVLQNNRPIFTDTIRGRGKRTSFTSILTVGVGDTVDLAVGYGRDITYDSDTTGVDVQFRPVSPVASEVLKIRPAVELSWPTQNGFIYQLQSAQKVTATNWLNVATPLPGGGNVTNFFPAVSNPALFYRLTAYTNK
jgi:hypothetical protein